MKFEIKTVPEGALPIRLPGVVCNNPGSPVDKLSFTIQLNTELTDSYFDEEWDAFDVTAELFPYVCRSCDGAGADVWHMIFVALHDHIEELVYSFK